MGKNRFAKENTKLLKGLSLGLIYGHGIGQSYRKLRSLKDKGKIHIGWSKFYSWNKDSVSFMGSSNDLCIDNMVMKGMDNEPCTIAEATN